MTQLTKRLYIDNDLFGKIHLFDIHNEQIRSKNLVQNAGWFNRLGERLGQGDLSNVDVKKIQCEIAAQEIFILISAEDTIPNVDFPGVDYVTKKARYIISKSALYLIDGYYFKEGRLVKIDDLLFTVVGREKARFLITNNTAV